MILLHLAINMRYLLDMSKLLGIMGGCVLINSPQGPHDQTRLE
jgi:hypothetical protein